MRKLPRPVVFADLHGQEERAGYCGSCIESLAALDEAAGAALPGQLAAEKAPTCRGAANEGAIRLSKNISTPTEPFSRLSQLEQLCSPMSVKRPLGKSRNNGTEAQITEFSSLSVSIHCLAH